MKATPSRKRGGMSISDCVLLSCARASVSEEGRAWRPPTVVTTQIMKFGHDLLLLEAGAPDDLRGQFIQYKQVCATCCHLLGLCLALRALHSLCV